MIDTDRFMTAVVVCTYKRPERMKRAVQQVFDQRGVDNQFVVIVDDGSDDGGATAVATTEMEQLFSGRTQVVRHEVNQGVARARTTGISTAVQLGASVICFHDDDEHWDDERLVRGSAPFDDPTVALTYGDQHKIDERVHETGEIDVLWSAPSRGFRATILDGLFRGRVHFPFQTVMFRADLCPELGDFKAVRESEDTDYAMRALSRIERDPGRRSVYVPHVLAYHVVSADSLSETAHNNHVRERVHREILAQFVPGWLVDFAFAISNRITRPVAVRLGRAKARIA